MWDKLSDEAIESLDLRALKSLIFTPHGGMTVELFGEAPKDPHDGEAAREFLAALNAARYDDSDGDFEDDFTFSGK